MEWVSARTPPSKVYETAKRRVPCEAHNARLSSITEPAIDILWSILRYYNGEDLKKELRFTIERDTWQLAQNRPPSIQELLACDDDLWADRYQSTFEYMQEKGFVNQSYILQKRIEWDPTPATIAIMGELFGGVYADCRSSARPDDAPLYGDQNESLTHRLGVELWYTLAQQYNWNPVRYPGEPNRARPDLRVTNYVHSDTGLGNVEVLTDHNNRELLKRKRDLMDRLDGDSFWVFENRAHATRVLNHWQDFNRVDLVNAPYSNPGNHALSKLNEYITRSRKNSDYYCPFITRVTTLPNIFDIIHN